MIRASLAVCSKELIDALRDHRSLFATSLYTLLGPVLLAVVFIPAGRPAATLIATGMFLLLAPFIGGMNVAIDTTAGERERGTLEPLLLQTAGPRSLVTGKWLATVVLSLFGVAVTCALSQLDLGVAGILGLIAVLLPLVAFATALQMLLSTFSRSFKEAQTYLSLLLFVPMLPGFLLGLGTEPPALWKVAVPILGQSLLLGEILHTGAASVARAALAGLVTLVMAAGFLALTAWLLRRERIIFGR